MQTGADRQDDLEAGLDLAAHEKRLIEEALRRCGGNKVRSAPFGYFPRRAPAKDAAIRPGRVMGAHFRAFCARFRAFCAFSRNPLLFSSN
jgi:hypothetical protein